MVSGGRGNPRGETTREGLRSRGANASELCKTFPPEKGVGNAGCRRTRSLACKVKKHTS
jgi:hypothetical protein